MTDSRWRKRQKDSHKCIHCSRRAFYDEDSGRFYTLCEVHLEIQREITERYRADLKKKEMNQK